MTATSKPEDLLSIVKDLQRQVKELRRGTLSNAVVSQGSIEVRTTGGQVIFRAGEIPWGGSTVTGIAGYRTDGSLALVSWDQSGANGYWALLDEAQNIIVSNDTNSGVGLATPYIPVNVMPYSQVLSPPQSTTNAAFENLHRAHICKQHPVVQMLLIVQSDAATTGEVQLADGLTVISAVTTIAASTNTYMWVEAPMLGAHMETRYVDVQARRTAGAGAIRIGVAIALGKQS